MKPYSKDTMHCSFASKPSERKLRCFSKPGMLPDILGLESEKNYSVYKASVLESKSKITASVEDRETMALLKWQC